MKKQYNTPALSCELFETSDVITVSVTLSAFDAVPENNNQIDTVDLTDAKYN